MAFQVALGFHPLGPVCEVFGVQFLMLNGIKSRLEPHEHFFLWPAWEGVIHLYLEEFRVSLKVNVISLGSESSMLVIWPPLRQK